MQLSGSLLFWRMISSSAPMARVECWVADAPLAHCRVEGQALMLRTSFNGHVAEGGATAKFG